MPTRPTATAPTADAVGTFDRIRATAVELFARQSYAATGIREIARACGISNAAIYHHVATKEELLVDIIRSGQQSLSGSAARSLEGVERPEDQLALLVAGLVAGHGVNPMIARVGDIELRSLEPGSPAHVELVGLRDAYEQLWSDALEAGRASGVFTVDEPHLTRLGLLAMCTGMSEWYRPDGPTGLDRVCAHFVGMALAAVHAERDGRPLTAADVPAVDLDDVPRMAWEPRAATTTSEEPDR